MTKPIRVGVAGAGVFGGHHSAKIASHPDAAFAGVYDIDPARAEALAARFDVSPFTDYSALVEAVDAVIIAAPASAHYELAQEALAAGRHVFVEKPIALDTADAEMLIMLARANGAVLQIGHQERYVAEAAGLLAIGKSPARISCVRRTTASGRCEDVSVVLDLMVHDLDLIRKLTNADIESLTATGDAHDAKAELALSNGALATLEASRRADAPERRMMLVYDDGVIEFDFVNRTTVNTTAAPLQADFDADDPPAAFCDPLGVGANAFIDAASNLREPLVTGEDGRDALDWARRIEDEAGIGLAETFEATERLRA